MSLYTLIKSLNLEIGTLDIMYNNIKTISKYLDIPLSKVKKEVILQIITGLKNYLTKENEIHLDSEQKIIVESSKNQNQRIIAGAGSGKTTTILYRIKYLLDNFITPDRILVLTFNKDSAQNIRNRIYKIFGFNIRINIYTIDAFCRKLMTIDNSKLYSLSEYSTIGLEIMKKYEKEICSQYKYIFFDEFQDVNDIQFNILKIFVDNGCYLSVIGDDCQNIYQFRGTDNYYMINFDRIVPNTSTYFLRTNYRSTKSIVDLANKSISFNLLKIDKDMIPCNKKKSKPELIINETEADSTNFIIKKINYYIKNGYKYDDIAILSRNSYPLKVMETELTKFNIPHVALITDKNSDDSKKLIEANKIVLTTIHKSKGLEWSIVIIIGLSQKHFPEHLNNNIKNIEEERRLFYVAVTRCKKKLFFVTHLKEFPLSVFLKETKDNINIISKCSTKNNCFCTGEMYDEIKMNYGVVDLVTLLNEKDITNMRKSNLIMEFEKNEINEYKTTLHFTENIKINGFEADVGEYCDRYITCGIINNILATPDPKNGSLKFYDLDTENILSNKEELDFTYSKKILKNIRNSYEKVREQGIVKPNQLQSTCIKNEIYWISLCRNFNLKRRRLVYRDIYNLIEENLNLTTDEDNLLNRMHNYIKKFDNKDVKCKIIVKHSFYSSEEKNEDNKCCIRGEIDLINNDTLIDFKCSESEFKLEWLLQLLIYYSLYNGVNKITKLCIINIMNGNEYTFNIKDISVDYKLNLIKFLENKIIIDQQSIRQEPSINYKILKEKSNILLVDNVKNITFEKSKVSDNIIILDTETTELYGDIMQLAYIVVDKNYNLIKTVNKFIKNRVSQPEALAIHHITIEQTRKNGLEFYDVMKDFINDLLLCDIVVGHNVAYDIKCIIDNLRKFEINIIDTEKNIINNIFDQSQSDVRNFIIHDTFKKSRKSLGNLYQHLFNKPINNAHDALADVQATFECYKLLFV
jgi:DNA polymerase III epsilon subunit-like protein